jgi:hypothetical protein
MAASWVKSVVQAAATAAQHAQTVTLGTTIAAGDHAVITACEQVVSDTISSCASSATGAVTSVDIAGTVTAGGGDGTTHTMGMCSIYFPNGALSTDTITVTWTAASTFRGFALAVEEYTGLATTSWTGVTATHSAGFSGSIAVPSGAGTVTATADGIAVCGMWIGKSTLPAVTQGTGWTLRALGANNGNSTADYITCEDRTVTNTNTYQGLATVGTAQDYQAGLVLYKAAGSAAAFIPQIIVSQ